jgi:hypothetical protein
MKRVWWFEQNSAPALFIKFPSPQGLSKLAPQSQFGILAQAH